MIIHDEKSLQLQKDENLTPAPPRKQENDGKYEQPIISFLKGALKNSL